ncbi:MAG: flippase-like domain-containing protein, partial [Candidatus Thermoplasmatota archaeon]|nr:flippase-like domain-containing protein [Candidatus Thermoplasmatota archaeon]
VTPGGFGGYLRALYLKYETCQPLPKCLGNIIIFNTIDLITLLVLGVIGAVVLSSYLPYLFYPILLFLVLVLFLLVFFLKKERSYTAFNRIVESRVFALLKNRIDDPLESFYDDLPRFRELSIPFTLSFVGWIVQISEFYLISRMFDVSVPYTTFLMISAVANVVGILPISIYGLGTRDATLISLFSIYSVLPERVISLSLYWFAVIWFIPSIIGAIITFIESKKLPSLTSELFHKI